MIKVNSLRKMRVIYFLTSLFVLLLMGQGCQRSQPDILLIGYLTSEIHIDGNIGEMEWNNATTITNLQSPWIPAEQDSTIFRCFCSPKFFNFCFEVIDRSLIILDYTDEMTVANGDRVELFFSPSSKLSPYYCIEMNPHGYTLDYKAKYHRKFDYSWNFSHHIVTGKITSNGYIVEGRISISELQTLGIDFKKGFHLGIFRADFTEENENSVIWYSWINPQVKEPDFHIPSAFGKCKLKI
ncbi:Carbohydrate family 9 binding domain-like [Porphyromonadaceae bacterium NLAE-zl-C104]|nr:Carbohydrate family 9 binding domain-like [Porphyromonadaceae bacterium NLAE-zl-C104]